MITFDLVCMLGPTRPIMLGFEVRIPMFSSVSPTLTVVSSPNFIVSQMPAPPHSVFGSRFIFLGIALAYLVAAAFFEVP